MANELRKCYPDLSRSEEKEQQLWVVGCFEREPAPQKVSFRCVGHALPAVTWCHNTNLHKPKLPFLVSQNKKGFRRHQHLSAGTEYFAMTAASHDGANRQSSVHACWKLADLVAYPLVQTNSGSSLIAKLLAMQSGSSKIKQVPSVLDICLHSCEEIHVALSTFIKLSELWVRMHVDRHCVNLQADQCCEGAALRYTGCVHDQGQLILLWCLRQTFLVTGKVICLSQKIRCITWWLFLSSRKLLT